MFPHHPWPLQDHHPEHHFKGKYFFSPDFPHSQLNDSLFNAERRLWFLWISSFTEQNGCGNTNPNSGKCQKWQAQMERAKTKKRLACGSSFSQGTDAERRFAVEHGCKKDP
jgi:hypothetical protein